MIGAIPGTPSSGPSDVVPVTDVPAASSDAARNRMRATRQRNTAAELALRRELHAHGLRYFVDRRPLADISRRADVVFPGVRVAVFVDGCFWHGCPIHGTRPKSNADWWQKKLDTNRRRDKDTDRRLKAAGWRIVRVWEHEDAVEAARRVKSVVQGARSTKPRRRK
jgi:DNA mismatch endonuclease (patch repair protein)